MGSCSYSISPSSTSPSASSGSGSFSMTAGSGCSWSASSDATSWLHTSSSGSGNGTVSYTYDANPNTTSRTGHITAGGQPFTVTQAGTTVSTPEITSPSPGSTLSSSSVTFQWSSGSGVSEYFLYVGSSFGTNDLYGQSQGLNLSQTVTGLPVDGSTLYVRLYWQISGVWYATDYTYTASTQTALNDNFANAVGMSGSSGQATGSNVGATKESGEPSHAGNSGGTSVWWYWTAPVSGQITIDTFGSSFDTLLAVYTGSFVGSLTPIASNDDSGSLQSQVTFTAVSGTTYRIAVDGWDGATGNIILNWGIIADFDMDGKVNFTDYAIFANHWMYQNCATPNWCGGTDFDHSGRVDWADFEEFAQHWLDGL